MNFPAYLPDVIDYARNSSQTISGVVPRADGYGPIPSPTPYSAALPGVCRGAFVAYKTDGTVAIFAATSTNLYKLDATTLVWSLVSKTGGYTGLVNSANWQFAQFNNYVLAVMSGTPPQFYDLTTNGSTTTGNIGNFDNLSNATGALGTPPNASYIAIVGRFVVLSGLLANPYAVQWSGLNAPATWDGTNSSSTQVLPDGGVVRGVGGGEGSAFIFQDFAIRSMTYTGEPVIVFQIQRISQDRGLYGPYTLTRAGEQLFFLAPQGLHSIAPGGLPNEIGKGKFNRTLMADIDRGNLQLAIGAIDPRQSRIFLAYKSNGNPNLTYDKLLCYDFLLDRASLTPLAGEYFLALSQPGITLEGLDPFAPGIINVTNATAGAAAFGGNLIRLTLSALSAGTPPGNIDLTQQTSLTVNQTSAGLSIINTKSYTFNIVSSTAPFTVDLTGVAGDLPIVAPPLFSALGSSPYTGTIGGSIDQLATSFDTFANAVTPEMAHFDTSNVLNWFRGAPMQANLDTGEQGSDSGVRMRVRGFRVITDATVCFGSIVARETQQQPPIVSPETLINAIGRCPANVSTRYARGRLRIPAGTIWTYANGVEPDFTTEGVF
jgi:hypothetical protein